MVKEPWCEVQYVALRCGRKEFRIVASVLQTESPECSLGGPDLINMVASLAHTNGQGWIGSVQLTSR